MLFTGTHARTLDEKNRLTLPKRVREQLGDVGTLFVTPGLDQCLWLFNRQGLEQLAAKIDEAPSSNVEVRLFRRLFFSRAEETEIDTSGRILIPDWLVSQAKLRHDVVLLGVRDHLELWDAGLWRSYFGDNASRFDAAADLAFGK